jgi:hypothetical protein
MVALTGTGRLADDIYLLAHHEVSGKPFLQPRAIGLGVAGGLLAELVLIGAIRVTGDRVMVTDRVRPQDGLMRAVHIYLLRERQRHGARDWLTFLAQMWALTPRPRMSLAGSNTRGIWCWSSPGVRGALGGGFPLMLTVPSRR